MGIITGRRVCRERWRERDRERRAGFGLYQNEMPFERFSWKNAL